MPGDLLSCSPLEAGNDMCEAPCSLGPHSPAHSIQLHRAGSLLCNLPCRQKPWEGWRRKGLSVDGVVHPLPRTLCLFLNSWLDIYPEEFCQTSDLSILKKLYSYLTVNMPDTELNHRVHLLLMDLQSSDSETEDEGDSGRCLRP